MGKKEKQKGSGLKYVPVNDFQLIPRHLVEQVKPPIKDIDKMYSILLSAGSNQSFWDFNLIGVFADHRHVVKGFMWATFNPITDILHVNIISVEKEYQRRGIIQEATNIMLKIKKQVGASKITFNSTRPKALERFGFVRSESVAMELKETDNG